MKNSSLYKKNKIVVVKNSRNLFWKHS